MKKIFLSDYSLQTLSENRPLLFREKAAVASALATTGVNALELPPIEKPREDAIVYKTIAAALHGVTLCLPVGAGGVAAAAECLSKAENPCLQIRLPVSPIQMEYELGLKEQPLLERISSDISTAAALCSKVDFAAGDALRAGKDFLLRACRAAAEAGCTSVTLCDEEGNSLPEEVEDLFRYLTGELSLPIYFKPSDKFGLALANAAAAVAAGCSGLKVAVRGGTALLTEKISALCEARGADLQMETDLNTTVLHSRVESILAGLNHPDILSGKTPSRSESGDEDVFLDSRSTVGDVKQATTVLGYELSEEDCAQVHAALLRICEKKSSVGRRELEAIVSSSAMQAPSTYHLNSYSVNTGNLTTSMAYISLTKDEETLTGIATGDGPIDCAFKAIENAIGLHYELDDFQLQAITEGKESLGSTVVRLRSQGKLYSGNGLSSDIVGAGIRAYINAVNKIVYEEQA